MIGHVGDGGAVRRMFMISVLDHPADAQRILAEHGCERRRYRRSAPEVRRIDCLGRGLCHRGDSCLWIQPLTATDDGAEASGFQPTP